jgi:hypothetical protein
MGKYHRADKKCHKLNIRFFLNSKAYAERLLMKQKK